MKPAPFGYVRPSSIEEVTTILAERGATASVIAGGQSLMPLLAQRQRRPAIVVDLAAINELRRAVITPEAVELGALVGQALGPELTEALPLLALALPNVGHAQTRNRGTIAGSVAHGDPLAEIPLALLVGGGEVELASARGRRRVPIDAFLDRAFAPARMDDELVVATHWARPSPGAGHAFLEITSGTTVAAAAAVVTVDNGQVTSARVGVIGPGERPVCMGVGTAPAVDPTSRARGEAVELAAARQHEEVLALSHQLATRLVDGVVFVDDAASDPEHRRAVAIELAIRALVAAVADSADRGAEANAARNAPDPPLAPGEALGADGHRPRSPAFDEAVEIDPAQRVAVTLDVDGRAHATVIEPRTSLTDALREVGVTGVKVGCEQGVCGSCTVLLDGTSQRSCLVLAVQVDGVEITTAAGLTAPIEELRTAFVDHFAVQCGFCASGVLVTAAAELAERQRAGTLDSLDRPTISRLLSGNVCRCTGYASMVTAIEQAAERLGAASAHPTSDP
ncbi:MAG: FAD binding domain-containing protein [Actinomycetota bacterium]